MKLSEIVTFRKALRKFERLIGEQNKGNIKCCQVSMAQCHALLEIEELGETTTGNLASSMKLDKSTLSRTLDSLVKSSHVERKENPSDRRYVILRLTQKGMDTVRFINHENNEYFLKIFETKSSDDLKRIVSVFEEMNRLL